MSEKMSKSEPRVIIDSVGRVRYPIDWKMYRRLVVDVTEDETRDDTDRGEKAHSPVLVKSICPLCKANEADRYDDHGGLHVCRGCGATYDPQVE